MLIKGVVVFDVGGVIVDSRYRHTETWPGGKRYRETPFIRGIVAVIQSAVEVFGQPYTHIVSKCDDLTARQTREMFEFRGFYDATGVLPDNVHTCNTREGKVPIVQGLAESHANGVTHAVDDRLEILGMFEGLVSRRILFRPDPAEIEEFRQHLDGIILAGSVAALVHALEM